MKKAIVMVVWLISIGLLTYSLIRTEQWILSGTTIIGWFLFSIQLTMSNSEKVYLFIKRIWFQLANPDCVWNMQVVYKGSFDRKIHEKIEKLLLQKNDKLRIKSLSNVRKIYTLGTVSFEVSIDEEEGTVVFSIQDMEVSYRRSKNLIAHELAKVFELLQMGLKPDFGKYGLIVEFKGYNPYFGFYVRRLNAKDVQGFNVTFKIDNDRVAVTKNCIEINTDSMQHLSILSKQYLTLSPVK